jgi:hypothetical protein
VSALEAGSFSPNSTAQNTDLPPPPAFGDLKENSSFALLARTLAGLQAGVTGGIIMLLYYSAGALLQRQYWWMPENLLGTAIYGNSAIWKGPGRATLAGCAWQLVASGLAGILYAYCFAHLRSLRFPVSWLVALAWSLGVYFVLYDLVLPSAAPLIPLYSTRATPLMAYLLLGLALARIPTIYRQLTRAGIA